MRIVDRQISPRRRAQAAGDEAREHSKAAEMLIEALRASFADSSATEVR